MELMLDQGQQGPKHRNKKNNLAQTLMNAHAHLQRVPRQATPGVHSCAFSFYPTVGRQRQNQIKNFTWWEMWNPNQKCWRHSTGIHKGIRIEQERAGNGVPKNLLCSFLEVMALCVKCSQEPGEHLQCTLRVTRTAATLHWWWRECNEMGRRFWMVPTRSAVAGWMVKLSHLPWSLVSKMREKNCLMLWVVLT